MNTHPCGRYFSIRAFNPVDMYRFESNVRLHAWHGCTGFAGAFRDDGVADGVGVIGDGCTGARVVVIGAGALGSGGTVVDEVVAFFESTANAGTGTVTESLTTCGEVVGGGGGIGDGVCVTVTVVAAVGAVVVVAADAASTGAVEVMLLVW